MKFSLVLLALAGTALSSVVQRNDGPPGCNGNNCARAVTGTRFAAPVQSQHRADCSSFMLVTVDPDGVVPNYTPTHIPEYATACYGTSAYSSACSCWGIPVTTTTIPCEEWPGAPTPTP